MTGASSEPEVEAAQLQGLAAAAGVNLPTDRAAALAPQAEQHFALLRALDDAVDSTTEPAGVFRLDSWTPSHHD